MRTFTSFLCFCICLSLAKTTTLPKNCAGIKRSGVQLIKLPYSDLQPFEVLCDAQEREGNWTVIQRRIDGSVDFYRSWQEYKNGFGNPEDEHWIGLERLHLITSYEAQELLIIMEDFENRTTTVHYSQFEIGSEEEQYRLGNMGVCTTNDGNPMWYHMNKNFVTYDHDSKDNWAREQKSGWWWSEEPETNLNGMYLKGKYNGYYPHGIYWKGFNTNEWYSLKSVKMMIRPTPY